MNENFNSPLMQIMREAIEENIRASLTQLQSEPNEEMLEMISYHLGWEELATQSSGKRIRPLLTLLSCGAAGGEWKSAIPLASAIELIHNFSLVHDDIEDNSETRRGRPTVWKRWGISKAINLGDAIFVLSRLSSYELYEAGIPAERVLATLRVLDRACLELTIGQQLDLQFEELNAVNLETYLRMIHGKTSALLSAATTCGGVVAGAQDDVLEILSQYGHHLGQAFQIRDDILGIWGETELTGKPTSDDLRSRKKTLPILYGLDHSEEFKELWMSEQDNDAALHAMRQALEASSARAFATEKAKVHTDLALSALASLKGKDPYQEDLMKLTRSLLYREQ